MQVDREFIKSISQKENFQPDIIEKIYRLILLLQEISKHPILDKGLLLKGGTAINFMYLSIPRLSIDLDFDFIGAVEKNEKDEGRKDIKKGLESIFKYFNYRIREKSTYGLHQFFLRFINSAGNNDLIKLEVNYLLRISLLSCYKKPIKMSFFKNENFAINTLSLEEIYAAKIKALLERTAARDLFDVYSLVSEKIKIDKNILRKLFIFFGCISKKDFRKFSIENVNKITEKDIRDNLMPLMRKGKNISKSKMVSGVKHLIEKLFIFCDNEKKYIDNFYKGIYSPELLFADKKIIDIVGLKNHPMVLWKQMSIKKKLRMD